jgi:hypothetical protein
MEKLASGFINFTKKEWFLLVMVGVISLIITLFTLL